MGQHQQTVRQPITIQQVDQSIKVIFEDDDTKYNPQNIAVHIQRILQNLSDMIPAQKTEEGFILNPKMIQIFYHKKFMYSMGKLINLLIDRLEEIMQKTLIMVKREEWTFCLNVVNFIIFFTDDKLIRMIETVGIRSDLSQNTAKFIRQLQNQGNEFTATQSLIDRLAFSEIQRIEKCLRISLNQMISMRTHVITRSEQTLKVIQKLQQACFILYLKTLYSPQHSQSILTKAKHVEYLKSNLTIGHYFLGKGSDLSISSIYECAVLMLFNLIQKNKDLREFKSLPTHLFKTLPIVSQNTVYDFVMNIALYSLTYIKQGNNWYSRFTCNRLMTLKLLDLLVKQVKISSPQITYYLEDICLQTRIGMIQRSFVTDLVQNYVNLIKQTMQLIEQQNLRKKQKLSPSSTKIKLQQQQHKISKYSRQRHVSQILSKYLQAGKQNYNIKYSNKKWKITTVDIITELENDQNIIQTQFRILCEKYIYEVILSKRVLYQYNDRQIWSEILPNIIEDKCDSSDGGSGGEEHHHYGREQQMRSHYEEKIEQHEKNQQHHEEIDENKKSTENKLYDVPNNTGQKRQIKSESFVDKQSQKYSENERISPSQNQPQTEDHFQDVHDHYQDKENQQELHHENQQDN